MINRGKLVILLMLMTAVAAAGVAWWYQFRQGGKVLQLWGSAAAYRIRLAPKCELWQLAPLSDEENDERLLVNDQAWTIAARRDITEARGLVHARQALIQDANYLFEVPPHDKLPDWSYALRFQDESGQTLLVFALADGWVFEPQSGRYARLTPIIGGLQKFFREQFES
jgi:hypothetical protein